MQKLSSHPEIFIRVLWGLKGEPLMHAPVPSIFVYLLFTYAVGGYFISTLLWCVQHNFLWLDTLGSAFRLCHIYLERAQSLWASLHFLRNVVLMRTESLTVLCCERTHYCYKSILSQFPSGLLYPVNSLHFCSPVLEACDGTITFLAEGRNGWLSGSVLRPNGLLFNIVLSSSSLSNHHLKKYNLHYIHSVLSCRTNQCSSLTVWDGLSVLEIWGINCTQVHGEASKWRILSPWREMAGKIGACSHDTAALFQFRPPPPPFKNIAMNATSFMPDCGNQCKVTFHFGLTGGKP